MTLRNYEVATLTHLSAGLFHNTLLSMLLLALPLLGAHRAYPPVLAPSASVRRGLS